MRWLRLVVHPTVCALSVFWLVCASAYAQGVVTCDDAWCHDDNPCTLDQCSLTMDGPSCDNPFDASMEGIDCAGHGWAVFCSGDRVCGAAFDVGMPNSCQRSGVTTTT